MSNDAYELKVQDLAKETLRTSELSKALRDMCEVFISEGHRSSDYSARACVRCSLVQEALKALANTTYYDELKHQEQHS